MYETDGAFPVPGPTAWASGSTTNISATYLSFDADWATYGAPFVAQCNANGLIPFVELEPWHWDSSAVLFSDITGGTWDTYLTGIGTAIAATGKPCILTFAHEMNVSGQYPWSQGDSGSGPSGGTLTAAEWVVGWKYVHDKINSTAGGHALWMWACSAWTGGTTINPSPWWPGSSYVDMVGIDGYPNTEYGATLGTFAGQIQPTVTAIRSLGWTQPIFLAETNLGQMVSSGGQSITSFVAAMHTAGISGILEFEDAAWGLPQMTAAQWMEYNNAISANYGTSGGGSSGGGSGGVSYTPTLIDGFAGSSLDTSKWLTPVDSEGISVSSGTLKVQGISGSEQVVVNKPLTYKLGDGIFGLQLSQSGTGASGTMWFFGIADGNDPLGNYWEFQTFPARAEWYSWAGTGAATSNDQGNQNILSPSVWHNGDWLAMGDYNLHGQNDVHVYKSSDAVTWTEIASFTVTGAIDESAICFYFGTNYDPGAGSSSYLATVDNVTWFARGVVSGGGGSGGTGGGTLSVVPQRSDQVSTVSGVATSVSAFSPSAGSMARVAATWLDADDLLGKTFTCQDSSGTSYALTQQGGDADGGCYLLVFDHVYAAAPGAITVTITCSNTATADCLIQPYVITGQAASQTTAAHNSFSEVGTSTNTYEIALTTTTPGSVVFVLGAPNNGGHPIAVPISGTTTDVDWSDDAVGSHGVIGHSTTPTVTPGSTTFGWTSVIASAFGYGVMASEVIPASPGSGGGTTGGGSTGTAFAAIGSWIETSTLSFSWTPAKKGNTLAVIAFSETSGAPVTGVSSTNAVWSQVVTDQTLGSDTITEATAFLGVATKPTASVVNLATTATTGNLRVLAHEFDSAGLTVALDTFVVMDADSGGDVTAWPSINPSKGTGELLFGFERNFGDADGAALAGSSSNTIYYVDANSNGGALNLGVSAPTVIGWGDNDARTVLALLLYAVGATGTGSGGGGTTTPTGGSLWYDSAEETELNAKAALLNGGSLGIYTGAQPALNGALTGTLLASLTFGSTAFNAATASGGIVTAVAKAIAPGVATASGTAGYFALVTSTGDTVATGTVGVLSGDLSLPSLSISVGTQVGVAGFALTQSETGD